MVGWPWRAASIGAVAVAAVAIARAVAPTPSAGPATRVALPPPPATRLGINLSALAPYNRQQVFANLIAQSEWFSSTGGGWTAMPAAQQDSAGWITALLPNQVAPRPLVLPAAPFGRVAVRCTYAGTGDLSAGGIAHVTARAPGSLELELVSGGGADEGAWIQLDRTDPADPLRAIDCRDRRLPASARFAPEFLASLRGFSAVRFLDWQLTNANRPVSWDGRTRTDDATQVAGDGVAIEDMVRLANEAQVDPWFLMPYTADATYIEGFARLVHASLDPGRTVYVELGNEVWNDMFDATLQARREGLAAGLAPPDDPHRAQTRRYAQKVRDAMRIWSRVFADRPRRLVRVAATIHVYPDIAETMLAFEDLPRWIDALATAPYIQLDLAGRDAGDVDWVFARLDGAVDAAIDAAERNRAIAGRYGKRYLTYEGGQHLVTRDMELARRVQRDPRMADVYRRYLDAWQARVGDQMMLYASVSPIGEAGAWGLVEYGGQPEADAPKLRAVRAFVGRAR